MVKIHQRKLLKTESSSNVSQEKVQAMKHEHQRETEWMKCKDQTQLRDKNKAGKRVRNRDTSTSPETKGKEQVAQRAHTHISLFKYLYIHFPILSHYMLQPSFLYGTIQLELNIPNLHCHWQDMLDTTTEI